MEESLGRVNSRLADLTIIGHYIVMKSAKVSELKARLSAYLAEVRRGETVIICDRNTPVARLVPYDEQPDGFSIEGPRRPLSDLKKVRGVKPRRPTDVLRLLEESRGDR